MSIFWFVYFCFCYPYGMCLSVCFFFVCLFVDLFAGLLIYYIIVNFIFFIILYMVFFRLSIFNPNILASWVVLVISPACTVLYILNCCCFDILHICMKNIVILDVIWSTHTNLNVHQNASCCIPEGSVLHSHCLESFKSYILDVCYIYLSRQTIHFWFHYFEFLGCFSHHKSVLLFPY